MLLSEKNTPPWNNFHVGRDKYQLWDRVNISFDIWTLIVLNRTMPNPARLYTWKKNLPHLWQIGMKRLHLSRWRCCLATWEKGHSCKGSGCVVWRWAESISTWIIRWIYLSGRFLREKMHSFGYCSNYLPPVPPIRLTCTTFFPISKFKIWKNLKILYILCIYSLKIV